MSVLFLALYELLVFGAAILFVVSFTRRTTWNVAYRASILLTSAMLTYIFGAVVAFIFTMTGINSAAAYLAIAFITFVAAIGYGLNTGTLSELRGVLRGSSPVSQSLISLAVVLMAPLVAASLYLDLDIDTLHVLTYLVLWTRNLATPYQTLIGDTGYPEFAELNYLPALVLTHNEAWIPIESLITLAVIFLAAYVVAAHLGLPRNLAFLAAFGEIVLWHFLDGSAIGIKAVKADLVVAAGILALVAGCLAFLRGRHDRLTGLLLTCSVVFLTAKYDGFAYVGIAFLLVVIIGWPMVRTRARGIFKWSGVTLMTFFATTGQYYVRNFVVYAAPFWPTERPLTTAHPRLFGYTFFQKAGERALIGPNVLSLPISILDNITHASLWSTILHYSYFGGFWFFFTFIVGLTLPAWALIAWFHLRRHERSGVFSRAHLFATGFTWIAMVVFIATPFTSTAPGAPPYELIANLGNFRYGVGQLVLVEIVVYALVWAVVSPNAIFIVLFAGIAIGARIQNYYEQSYIGINANVFFGVMVAALAAVFLVRILSKLPNRRASRALLGAVAITTMAAVTTLWPLDFRSNQEKSWAMWLPAYNAFWASKPERIGVAYVPTAVAPLIEADPLPALAIVAGEHLQNQERLVASNLPRDELKGLSYVVWLQHPYLPPDPSGAKAFAAAAARRGFKTIVATPDVVIARRS